MIKQLAGMVDTNKLSDWENRFMKNVVPRTGNGTRTSILTGEQLEKVEEIYTRHIAS